MTRGFGLSGGVEFVFDGLLMGFCSSSIVVGEGRSVSRVKSMSVVGGLVNLDQGFLRWLLVKVTFSRWQGLNLLKEELSSLTGLEMW